MIRVRRNICVHTTVSEKVQFCQQINTLSHFAISPGKSALCYWRLAITSVLLGVGHELKEIVLWEREYGWRGLAMKIVLGIIFLCNLSHTVCREIID